MTSAFACSLTMSTSISTAAWNRPGTPAVERRAASQQDQEDDPGAEQREEEGVPVNDGEIEQAVLLAVREVVEVVVDVTRQPPFVATLARHPALLEHRSSVAHRTSSPTVPLRQRRSWRNLALRTGD